MPATGGRFRIEFPSDLRCLRPVVHRIAAAASRTALEPEALFRLRVALSEAVSNAILHGNGADPRRRVRVTGRMEPGAVRVSVRDEGGGFDAACMPDPTVAGNLFRPSGRGLLLIRGMADAVEYVGRGNEVRLEVRSRRDHRHRDHRHPDRHRRPV